MSLISNRYYRFARVALQLAKERDQDTTYQLCALVVNKNRVLSVGYNTPKTHPIAANTRMQELHAEMDAVVRCDKKDLVGADVIVVRARSNYHAGLAKPCEICQNLLSKLPIRRIYYSTSNEELTLEELVDSSPGDV